MYFLTKRVFNWLQFKKKKKVKTEVWSSLVGSHFRSIQDTRGLIDLPWILLSGINVLLALISCRLCNLCAGFLGALTDVSEEAHPFCGLTAFGF